MFEYKVDYNIVSGTYATSFSYRLTHIFLTIFHRFAFFAAFFISVSISNTLMSVVSTASDTTIVCFAEGPTEFEQNHPLLHAKMQETFSSTYPDVNFVRGTTGEVV